MDTKVKLALKEPVSSNFDYQGNSIFVKPYLSMSEQDELTKEYIQQYFGDSPNQAEYFLMFSILDLCTNVELFADDERTKPSLPIDEILSHWDMIQQIRTRILNYGEFYARLQAQVRHEDLVRNSLKSAIDTGYAKLLSLIDQIKIVLQTEITPEQIDKIKGLVAEVEASPILEEAVKLFGANNKEEELSPTPRKTRSRKSK